MLWSEHSLNDWDVQHSHPKSSYKTLSKTGCSISNDFEFLFKKICVGVIHVYQTLIGVVMKKSKIKVI